MRIHIAATAATRNTIGRRRAAVVVTEITALGVFGSYSLHDPWALTACLALGVFDTTAVLPETVGREFEKTSSLGAD